MLGPFVPLVVGTHILMVASSGPPKVDIRATCQTSVDEVAKVFRNTAGQTLDACLKQQNESFEQIEKNWATYPASVKAHCVQPRVYMPSYVEWLTCFEMEVEVRKTRLEEAKAAQAKDVPPRRRSPNSRISSEIRRCPVVNWAIDGSVDSVIVNC